MTTFDQAVRAIAQHDSQFQQTLESWSAYLGDGAGNVRSDTDKNRYFCRYPTSDSPASEVISMGCPPVDGMRVRVGYSADQPKVVRILSWIDPAFDNTDLPLQKHGNTHSYLQGDTTWIDWRQILTLKVQPYSGLIVYVNGGVLPRSGVDLYVLPQIVDMSGSVPNTIGEGRYALLSLDPNGDVIITNGTPITPGMALDISNVPNTPSGNFRLAAIQLVYGQTTIEETTSRCDILDLRWPQETIAGSLAPGSIGGATAQYQYLVSGAGPTYTAQWSNGYLAITSGKTLTAQNNLTLSGTDGKALTLTGSLTIGADTNITGGGTIGMGGFTLTVSGNSTVNGSLVGNMTGGGTVATGGFTLTIPATGTAAIGAGTLTVSTTNDVTGAAHTHAITSSSNPGAAASILASSNGGGLTLTGITTLGGATDATQVILISNASSQINPLLEARNSAGGAIFRINQSNYGGQFFVGYHTLNPANALIALDTTGNLGAFFILNRPGTAQVCTFTFKNANVTEWFLGTSAGSTNFELRSAGNSSILSVDKTINNLTISPSILTTGINNIATFNNTGSGANGDGGSIIWSGKSSTTTAQSMAVWQWLWADATHATRKARITSSVYDTAARQWLQVDTNGSASSVQINSLLYGSMYGNDMTVTVTIAAADTYVEVGSGLTGGVCNGFTFQNSKELLCLVAGTYSIEYSMTVEPASGANVHIEGGVMINSTGYIQFANATHCQNSTDEQSVSGSNMLTLAVNDVVKLCVKEETGTINVVVTHANLSLERVGV